MQAVHLYPDLVQASLRAYRYLIMLPWRPSQVAPTELHTKLTGHCAVPV